MGRISLQTYVKDQYRYDDCSSDKTSRYSLERCTLTYNANGYYSLYSTSNDALINFATHNGNWRYEVIASLSNKHGGICCGAELNFTFLSYFRGDNYLNIHNFDHGNLIESNYISSITNNVYYKWIIERNGYNYTISLLSEDENTTYWTKTYTWENDYFWCNFMIGVSGKTVNIKNISIETL